VLTSFSIAHTRRRAARSSACDSLTWARPRGPCRRSRSEALLLRNRFSLSEHASIRLARRFRALPTPIYLGSIKSSRSEPIGHRDIRDCASGSRASSSTRQHSVCRFGCLTKHNDDLVVFEVIDVVGHARCNDCAGRSHDHARGFWLSFSSKPASNDWLRQQNRGTRAFVRPSGVPALPSARVNGCRSIERRTTCIYVGEAVRACREATVAAISDVISSAAS